MSRSAYLAAAAAFMGSGLSVFAADLPPDAGKDIPKNALRPVVVQADAVAKPAAPPEAILPEGMELITAAAAPLVLHPIMGCLDDRGRLFVGDATGVNWNKAQLEANPPNRVLLLEDVDKDGVFDKSTVFADKMTFPQGAAWLKGSLYVCSPPGLWKLTDADGDGVAEKREMIVKGFEYTGNAADVHGPFVHPNGRLYWCHGRKGHKVIGKDGEVVHEGQASGIWSCQPDGSDVQWHALGCGDNPVEVDFTPEGDVIGVENLYHSQPRGDTLMHWLYGGVYERSDQMKAIEGLPRTLEHMPVMHNFGHVAVSGCTFYRSGVLFPKNALSFLVTHFNTQRVVRMDLTPDGATFKATENEFIKLANPDIHFTDVMEDADGSVLVIDTGGWFRIGCPASLMAKPDIAGAVYRVRRKGAVPVVDNKKDELKPIRKEDYLKGLQSTSPQERLHTLEAIAHSDTQDDAATTALKHLLGEELDPATEHAAIYAAYRTSTIMGLDDLRQARNPLALRRMLLAHVPDDSASVNLAMGIAAKNLDSTDASLARVALNKVISHPDADEWVAPDLKAWLSDKKISPQRLTALEGFGVALIGKPETQKLISTMLRHYDVSVRLTAFRILAGQTGNVVNKDWIGLLTGMLKERHESLPLLMDALKKLRSTAFDEPLQHLANDEWQPLSLRLRALDSIKGLKLTPVTFALLHSVLTHSAASSAARIQAAAMLASAPLLKEQVTALTPALATVGPVELKELSALIRKAKDADAARAMAVELAKNPVIASQQESFYRTAFSNQPPEIFETVLLPAIHKANEATDARKRQLGPLADKAIATGDAKAGHLVYESGKGTCIACHKIGDKGRSIGPDLSKIGAIRTERDLVESILFPSNTLARDYEAHVIETSDGQSVMGVIKSHTAEGLLVADLAGQEKNVPHAQIISDTTLTMSLMPMGLDQTMPEKDLLDLVAYLRSLR